MDISVNGAAHGQRSVTPEFKELKRMVNTHRVDMAMSSSRLGINRNDLDSYMNGTKTPSAVTISKASSFLDDLGMTEYVIDCADKSKVRCRAESLHDAQTKTYGNALTAALADSSLDVTELAALIDQDPKTVKGWCDGIHQPSSTKVCSAIIELLPPMIKAPWFWKEPVRLKPASGAPGPSEPETSLEPAPQPAPAVAPVPDPGLASAVISEARPIMDPKLASFDWASVLASGNDAVAMAVRDGSDVVAKSINNLADAVRGRTQTVTPVPIQARITTPQSAPKPTRVPFPKKGDVWTPKQGGPAFRVTSTGSGRVYGVPVYPRAGKYLNNPNGQRLCMTQSDVVGGYRRVEEAAR